jgi:hypothetical protein
MNISNFDIQGLQSLFVSYKHIISDHLKQLEEQPNDEFGDLMRELLKQKIESFELQLNLIEERINELNAKKLRFSTEFMFWNYGLRNRSVQVHFLTTSKAYKTYGPYVTGQVLFDKSKTPDLLEGVIAKTHSDGVIRFEEIVFREMPENIKENLRNEGFYASEISHINFL